MIEADSTLSAILKSNKHDDSDASSDAKGPNSNPNSNVKCAQNCVYQSKSQPSAVCNMKTSGLVSVLKSPLKAEKYCDNIYVEKGISLVNEKLNKPREFSLAKVDSSTSLPDSAEYTVTDNEVKWQSHQNATKQYLCKKRTKPKEEKKEKTSLSTNFVEVVEKMDVICGPFSKEQWYNPGNILFRELCRDYYFPYLKDLKENIFGRKDVAKKVVDSIISRGGRFLVTAMTDSYDAKKRKKPSDPTFNKWEKMEYTGAIRETISFIVELQRKYRAGETIIFEQSSFALENNVTKEFWGEDNGKVHNDPNLTWEKMFLELVLFKSKHGHCSVPTDYKEQYNLGRWVNTMRIYYRNINKKKKLNQEKRQTLEYEHGDDSISDNNKSGKLKCLTGNQNTNDTEMKKISEEVDCCFRTDKIDDEPDANVIDDFYDTDEHFFRQGAPKKDQEELSKNKLDSDIYSTQSSKDKSLNELSFDFRTPRKKLSKSALTPSRITALGTIGFNWNFQSSTNEKCWEKNYDQLCAFTKKHGHTRVPLNGNGYNSLGRWVARQRSLYRGTISSTGKVETLRIDRKIRLEKIGFKPGKKQRRNWNQYVDDLMKYKAEFGDCNVPQHWGRDKMLGKWVAKQRYMYNLKMRNLKSYMSNERICILKNIGFHWGDIRVGNRDKEGSIV